MAERDLNVNIKGNARDLTQATNQAERDLRGISDGKQGGAVGWLMAGFAGLSAAAGSAAASVALEFGKAAWSAATEATDARANLERTFGGLSDQFIQNGKKAADTLAIPAREYEKAVASIGQQLVGLGFSTDQAAGAMDPLISRLADVAARSGKDLPTALEAFGSLLRGERDPIEQFGVAIKESDVQARLAEKGLSGLTGEALKQASAQASLELFMEKTASSTGALAERSQTAAGKLDTMSAKYEDIKANVGSVLQAGFVAMWEWLEEVIPPIIDWLHQYDEVWAAIGNVIKFVWDVLVAWLSWYYPMLAKVYMLQFQFLGLIWDVVNVIADFLDPVTKRLWWTMQGVWNVITEIGKVAWWVFQGIWNVVSDVATKIWWAFQGIWNVVSFTFNQIVGAARFLGGIISAVVGGAISGIRAALEALWGVASRVLSGIQFGFGVIRSIVDTVASAIRTVLGGAIDAFKRLWNSTLGGKGFDVPSWVPGIGGKGFRIPMLAAGGIVTSPTIAMIGERGPEAVVPLDRSGGLGSTVISVTVNAGVGDPAEIGRQVIDAIRAAERVQGSGWRVVA